MPPNLPYTGTPETSCNKLLFVFALNRKLLVPDVGKLTFLIFLVERDVNSFSFGQSEGHRYAASACLEVLAGAQDGLECIPCSNYLPEDRQFARDNRCLILVQLGAQPSSTSTKLGKWKQGSSLHISI